MPVTLTEEEVEALIQHLELESWVAYRREELEDVQDDASMFGDDEHSEEDHERAIEEAQNLQEIADEAVKNSRYVPPGVFDGTPLFNNLCVRVDTRTTGEGDPLSIAELREFVLSYLASQP